MSEIIFEVKEDEVERPGIVRLPSQRDAISLSVK